ncbi:MAG: permease-like cell division protein FtsX [Bacteroidales bacterium]|jgi:cell division transport system permease protein|nr:permease-like cell division protein FtsX [Bacteroidales bacterium]
MTKYADSIDKITKARLKLSAFGSILSLALTMFFIGTLVFFAFFSFRFINNISKKIEIEILFYPDIKEADIMAFEQNLKLQPYISASRFSSQLENTKEAIKTIGNDYTEIIANPINASVIISVTPEYANSDSLTAVSKKIKSNSFVQDVQYSDTIVKAVLNNFVKIQVVILGLCAVFMIISMLLIGNYLRLTIYAKRFSIRSMLLVGATKRFVRKPFLFKGFVQGVWGGFIALIILAVALYEGNKFMPEFIDFSDILSVSILLGGLFLFSIIFTVLVSLTSVNKYISINTDRLYL